jgi:hypothetical protein
MTISHLKIRRMKTTALTLFAGHAPRPSTRVAEGFIFGRNWGYF